MSKTTLAIFRKSRSIHVFASHLCKRCYESVFALTVGFAGEASCSRQPDMTAVLSLWSSKVFCSFSSSFSSSMESITLMWYHLNSAPKVDSLCYNRCIVSWSEWDSACLYSSSWIWSSNVVMDAQDTPLHLHLTKRSTSDIIDLRQAW